MRHRARPRRLWPKVLAGAVVLLAAIAVGVAWFARTETALRVAVELLAAQTGGKVTAEGVAGSILGPLQFARITYRDDPLVVTANDVEVQWSFSALWHHNVSIAELHAGRVEVSLPAGEETRLPDTLALPWMVEIDRARIDTIALRKGKDESVFQDVEFRYAGGPERHRLTDVALSVPRVRIGGVLDIAAARPFAVLGSVRAEGEDALAGVEAEMLLGGTLDALDFTTTIDGHGATLAGDGQLAPFARQWLPRLALHADQLDLAAADAAYPRTAIALHIDAHSDDKAILAGAVSIKNALAGPITDHRLPLVSVRSNFALRGAAVDLAGLQADLGVAGRVSGSGRVAASGSRWSLAVDRLNLRALHRPLRATALKGQIKADVTGDGEVFEGALAERAVAFKFNARRRGDDVEVRELVARVRSGEINGKGSFQLSGTQKFAAVGGVRQFNPAEFGAYPAALLNGRFDVTGVVQPEWSALVQFALADSRFRGAPLGGQGSLRASIGRIHDANVALRIGENRLEAEGGLGKPQDALHVSFDGARLAQLDARVAGRLALRARLTGKLDRPTVSFEGHGESLRVLERYAAESMQARGVAAPDMKAPLQLNIAAQRVALPQGNMDSFAAKFSGSFALHEGELHATGTDFDIDAQIAGAWTEERKWRGTLVKLAGTGTYPMRLAAPVPMEIGPAQMLLGPAQVAILDGQFNLQRLRWEAGRVESEGEFTRLPAAPLLALAGWPTAPGSDLTLRGTWSIEATPRLNGFVRISREAGDLRIDADAPRGLGLRQLDADVKLVEDVISAHADAVASTFGVGTASAEITPPARAAPGGISPDAVLRATASAKLDSLRGLDALAGLDFVIDARVSAALTGTGTLRAPVITGTLDAKQLRLDVPRYGIALKDGTAHGKLDANALSLEATLAAAAGGRLVVTGTSPRKAEAGATKIEWRAAELRLFNRRERRLTVSGGGSLAFARNKLVVRGEVRADEGRIEFERQRAAHLSDDVVVLGWQKRRVRTGPLALPLDVDLLLDAGPKFAVMGAGLDAVLRGRVRVQSRPTGALFAKGTIETARGTYFAFGRDIEIERGRLYFDGPIDDPAIDVRALRRDQAVQAGVEVTGTVRVPLVRLVSDPPVSDAEKLSWLVLGRPLDSASTADFGLLQSAAGALVDYGDSIPIQRRLAGGIGLDNIAVRGSGALGSQVVAAGKRLSDKLYLEYEQGLTGASNIVRLNYVLTRTLKLRAETGTSSGVGVTYGLTFD